MRCTGDALLQKPLLTLEVRAFSRLELSDGRHLVFELRGHGDGDLAENRERDGVQHLAGGLRSS